MVVCKIWKWVSWVMYKNSRYELIPRGVVGAKEGILGNRLWVSVYFLSIYYGQEFYAEMFFFSFVGVSKVTDEDVVGFFTLLGN